MRYTSVGRAGHVKKATWWAKESLGYCVQQVDAYYPLETWSQSRPEGKEGEQVTKPWW